MHSLQIETSGGIIEPASSMFSELGSMVNFSNPPLLSEYFVANLCILARGGLLLFKSLRKCLMLFSSPSTTISTTASPRFRT